MTIVESIEDVKNAKARAAIEQGEEVGGWYETGTQSVYLYLPNLKSIAEIDYTYIHEVVAHKGLRTLMGEKFNALCDKVWESMGKEAREKFLRYVNAVDINAPSVAEKRAAADEYMAWIAEGVDLTDADKTVWTKIVEFFREFVEKLGVKISDKDIEKLIKASYANLAKGENGNAKIKDRTMFRKRGNKKSPDTATQKNSVRATAVSSDLLAKIETLKEIYNKKPSKRTRGFITDVSKELNLTKDGPSHYRTFSTPLGDITLRVSNHNSKLKKFEQRYEDDKLRLYYARPFAASIVYYNSATLLKQP